MTALTRQSRLVTEALVAFSDEDKLNTCSIMSYIKDLDTYFLVPTGEQYLK